VTKRELRVLLLLGLGAMATGVAVVHAKYLTRMEFVALQALISERQALEVQWGRLRLEEAALTTHPRVEERARRLMSMHLPRPGEVLVIEVDGHGG
jgi:cell division protein FtsL